MKVVLKIINMRSVEDVNKIRKKISKIEGIVACQINQEKSEVSVVFDDYFTNEEKIINNLEDLGYSVI